MRGAVLSWTCLAGMLAGCARTQSFRVVDAQTGQPLAGVWVAQGGEAPSAGYNLRTDPIGMVQFPKAGTRYLFTKEGYQPGHVELKGPVARVRYEGDAETLEVKRYGDLVQVPLRRRSGAGPP